MVLRATEIVVARGPVVGPHWSTGM